MFLRQIKSKLLVLYYVSYVEEKMEGSCFY